MPSIEDFIMKNNKSGGIDFQNLYVEKIERHHKKQLRLLEDKDSDMIKKFVKIHSYLPGLGNSPCNMTQENVDNGNPCKFCVEFINQLNKINKDQMEWLGTTSISKSISENSITLNNDKVYSIGDTFSKDISNLLNEEEKKIYDSFAIKKGRVEGKLAKTKFFAPVYDYGTDDVRIYEFGPAVFNQIENAFTIPGLKYTSADFVITHNAQLGNWWVVSKKDSSPIDEKIVEKYNNLKKKIENEFERRTKMPTPEEQEELFKKYLEGVEKKAAKLRGDDVSEKKVEVKNDNDNDDVVVEKKEETVSSKPQESTDDLVDLF